MPTQGFSDSTMLSKQFCCLKPAWHHTVVTANNQTQAAQVMAWDAQYQTYDLKKELHELEGTGGYA